MKLLEEILADSLLRNPEAGEDGLMCNIARPGRSLFLKVISSWGGGWDHVSVSLPSRVPHWDEMELVRYVFFKPEETVMQLHVPPEDHVNFHATCLHLWRPQVGEIPRPPGWMVG